MALQACAHQPPVKVQRVALMPVDAVGVPPREGETLHRALHRALQHSETAKPSPAEPLRRSLAQQKTDLSHCLSSDPCLSAVGRDLSADLVLTVTMAGLGSVRLVRSRLFEIDPGIVLKDIQETTGADSKQIERYVGQLARRLFPPPPGRPWYRRWWVWTAAAAAVGATVGITLLATTQDSPRDPGVIRLGEL